MFELITKIFKKEPEPKYPIPFGLIKFTEIALLKNIKDEQNKIIVVYQVNDYGNIEQKKYKYSEVMVSILENKGIPIYDKTKTEQRFAVFLKEIPGEITYTK